MRRAATTRHPHVVQRPASLMQVGMQGVQHTHTHTQLHPLARRRRDAMSPSHTPSFKCDTHQPIVQQMPLEMARDEISPLEASPRAASHPARCAVPRAASFTYRQERRLRSSWHARFRDHTHGDTAPPCISEGTRRVDERFLFASEREQHNKENMVQS